MAGFFGTGALDAGYGSYFWPQGFLPYQILNNQWVIFLLFFAIFFSVSFFSLSKAFKGTGRTPAAVVSFAVGLLMAAGIQGIWPQFSKTILVIGLIILGLVMLLLLFGRGKNVFLSIITFLSLIFWLWPIWSDAISPFTLSNLPWNFIYFLDAWHWVFFYVFLVSIVLFFIRKEGRP
jgi:hypothetical protein